MSRFENYDNDVCWQYRIKEKTLADDLAMYGEDFVHGITLERLEFARIDKSDAQGCADVTAFIERYEWLGKMPVWVTDRFVATYQGLIVCAVVMATPNAFSNLLGAEYRDREKLVARGASVSFAPQNTASWMITKAIKWMVQNTDFRVFTAYSDPTAGELGTVYQACNWYYLGQTFGGSTAYISPYNGEQYGSTYFNQRATIKRVARNAGVDWQPNYTKKNKSGSKTIIAWENIPEDVITWIKAAVQEEKRKFIPVKLPPKHKYVQVLGRGKLETKQLRKLLHANTQTYDYPTERGA